MDSAPGQKSASKKAFKSGLITPNEGDPVDEAAELMAGILTKIKGAWIAALVSGTLTLAVVAYVVFLDSSVLNIDEWVLLDVVIIYGLAFGIYKKSRIAAVSMFVYFVISKAIMYIEGETRGTWMAAIFLFLFAQGVYGCFQYHSLKKRSNSQA